MGRIRLLEWFLKVLIAHAHGPGQPLDRARSHLLHALRDLRKQKSGHPCLSLLKVMGVLTYTDLYPLTYIIFVTLLVSTALMPFEREESMIPSRKF